MRHLPLSVSGLLAAALLCAAVVPLRPALAQQTQQTPPSPKPAGGTTKTERRVTLRFIRPSEFMTQLAPADRADKQVIPPLLPIGTASLSPDDTKNRLTVTGTPEAVQQIVELVRLLDVKPRQVRLQVRILRAPIMATVSPTGGLPEGQAVTVAEAMVRNNVPLNLHAVGDGQLFRVFVTPHINGDQSITLSAELSEVSSIPISSHPAPEGTHAAEVNIKNSRSWTRRIAGGTRTVVASVPNEIDRTAAYYLEITPVIGSEKQL